MLHVMQKIRIVLIVLIVIIVWFRFLKPGSDAGDSIVPEVAEEQASVPVPAPPPVERVEPVEQVEPLVVMEEPKVEPAAPTPASVVEPEVIPEPELSQPEFVRYVAPVSAMAVELHKPGKTVNDDLDILDSLMSYYHSVFKSMPAAGDNVEFVDALVGMNEKGVQVLPHDHPSINEKGELVDRWGTAYFFHPMSDKVVEIISAGPDRTLFTDDDVQL